MLKRGVVVGLMGMLLGSGAAGQQTEGRADDAARVRFIHAVPHAPAFDVNLGSQSLVTAVRYGQATPWKKAPAHGAQDGKITLTPSGGGQVIEADQSSSLRDHDRDYTILALPRKNTADGVEVRVIKTPRPEPGTQSAMVTLINAVPDVRALDFFLGEKKLHAGVNYGGHNGPDKVPSGRHTISVHTNEGKVMLPSTVVDLAAGSSYTAIVYGTAAGGIQAAFLDDLSGLSLTSTSGDSPTTASAAGESVTTPMLRDSGQTTSATGTVAAP